MKAILAFIFLGLASCAMPTTRTAMSGKIGCPSDNIQVLSHDPGLFSSGWVVQCGRQRFVCSSVHHSDGNSLNDMSCSRMASSIQPGHQLAEDLQGDQGFEEFIDDLNQKTVQ